MGGGGGWSQALSMYFFSGEFAVHDVFLDIRRLQHFFLNITLELFFVFRNTEYNGSKYAHFSLYCFINDCEFIITIF